MTHALKRCLCFGVSVDEFYTALSLRNPEGSYENLYFTVFTRAIVLNLSGELDLKLATADAVLNLILLQVLHEL